MREQIFVVGYPVFEEVSVEAHPFSELNLSSFIKLNRSGVKVESFMRKGNKYIFHLPESNIFLYVICDFKGYRQSDMIIIDCIKNGVQYVSYKDYMFSYNYENFDWINFMSFSKKEHCDIYLVNTE
jgi:hypothetical protein